MSAPKSVSLGHLVVSHVRLGDAVCVCASVCHVWACNHNLRHWQQVWDSDNSFQFHLVGRVIDAPVAIEDGGDVVLGYLPRYYVNGSGGPTDNRTCICEAR